MSITVLDGNGDPQTLDPPTQATLAAILAKIIAAPSTEAKQDAIAALLTTQAGYLDGLEAGQASILAKIIAAPATEAKQDTQVTALGALTETAPATDTASSGLNGRLQRIAQRITSLIALLPAALGAGGGLKIDGSGTALPVTGSLVASGTIGIDQTTPGTTNGVAIHGKKTTDGDTALAIRTGADGLALADVLAANTSLQLYNGATTDLMRRNVEATALASAARTATAQSADIVNYNHSAILIFLRVTAASGTGGLTVRVEMKDPVSAQYFALNAAPTAIVATGNAIYIMGRGVTTGGTGNANQVTALPVPTTFRINVGVGDASSYTYSVGYSLVMW